METLNGFLILDKPLGATSSNVVVRVRRQLPKGTAVGHGGTLDPEASGVLPICVGTATRLFDYIIDKQKTYVAELRLGEITDTQDATGQVVETRPVTCGEAEVRAALPGFVGEIEQIPPMYSAVKKDGRRLYQLARRGETVEMPARRCVIHGIEYLEQTDARTHRLRVTCGKGVYIRTLCHDIGQALGCGAHMASLRRTAAGIFTLENACTPEQAEKLAQEGRLAEALIAPDAPLGHIPAVRVGAERLHAVKNGNTLRAEWLEEAPPAEGTVVRVYCGGAFAGMGEAQAEGSIRFKAMLLR